MARHVTGCPIRTADGLTPYEDAQRRRQLRTSEYRLGGSASVKKPIVPGKLCQ
jgi:hypothetical protein